MISSFSPANGSGGATGVAAGATGTAGAAAGLGGMGEAAWGIEMLWPHEHLAAFPANSSRT
ncbi:MAG: hypothetical protein JW719_01205 [Pirellulales bacterium]|nr:hypothetical protein [Pirellulales bacterium]